MKRFLLVLVITSSILISPLAMSFAQESEEGAGYMFWLNFLQDNPIRDAGKPEDVDIAMYIADYYETYNLEPYQEDQYIMDFNYTYQDKKYTSYNVAGVMKSNNEDAKSIIIGAHYDNISIGEVLSVQGGKGAYDNASGVAGMIEIMDRFSRLELDVDVIFIAFGAEEVGLFGSRYIVDNMSQEEIDNTLLMINFDSIICGDYLYLYTDDVRNIQEDYMLDIAKEKDIDIKRVSLDKKASVYENIYTGYNYSHLNMYSDHAPFMGVGIDVAFFIGYNMEDIFLNIESLDKEAIMHTQNDNIRYILDLYGEEWVKARIEGVAKIVESFISDKDFEQIMIDSKADKFNYRWMANPQMTLILGYGIKGLIIALLLIAVIRSKKKYPFNIELTFPKRKPVFESQEKHIFEDLGI